MKIRPRYSLKLLLLLITAMCVWGGVVVERGRKQEKAVRQINSAKGVVYYSFEFRKRPSSSFVRRLLVGAFGIDNVYSVVAVTLRPTEESTADTQIEALRDLRELRHVAIWPGLPDGSGTLDPDSPGGLTDQGALRLLTRHSGLDGISLSAARLSDSVTGRIIADPRFDSVGISRHTEFGGDRPAFSLSFNGRSGTRTSAKFAGYKCPSEMPLAP